jgi:hypothetical protein
MATTDCYGTRNIVQNSDQSQGDFQRDTINSQWKAQYKPNTLCTSGPHQEGITQPTNPKLPNKIQWCYTDGTTTDKSGATLAPWGYCVPKSQWCTPGSKTLSKDQAQPIFNQQQKIVGTMGIGNMNNYQGGTGVSCKVGNNNTNLGQFPLYNDVFCYTSNDQKNWAYCDNTDSPPSPPPSPQSGMDGKDIAIGVVVFVVVAFLIYIFFSRILKNR